eukprot:4394029-Amphidinium_carterae.1
MRLEEPDAKRQRPEVAAVEGDYDVSDEDWELTLPRTATHEAAGAARGEAASAVEQEEEYVDD